MNDAQKRLHELDEQLGRLLNERIQLHAEQRPSVEHLAAEMAAGLDAAARAGEKWFPSASLRLLYQHLHGAVRHHLKEFTVAYFGPPASYTHAAALQRFGFAASYIPLTTIADIFAEVETGRAGFGVVPVENTTEGAVQHTLDTFVESEVRIVAEIALRISHTLMSQAKSLNEIDSISSHPQALAQCQHWLAAHAPSIPQQASTSTAAAAKECTRNPRAAAIASEQAAALYGLNIVADHIEDSSENYTRFLVLSTTTTPPTGRDKTSLVCGIPDKPGALFATLELLAQSNINMKKIESRPRKSKPWEYVFFIDIEGHQEEEPVRQALSAMRQRSSYLKVLGSYPQAPEIEKTMQRKDAEPA